MGNVRKAEGRGWDPQPHAAEESLLGRWGACPKLPRSLAGEHGAQLGLHGGSGDGLGDESATVEEGETSPDPQPQQGRKTRREACTCPYCKEGEGR